MTRSKTGKRKPDVADPAKQAEIRAAYEQAQAKGRELATRAAPSTPSREKAERKCCWKWRTQNERGGTEIGILEIEQGDDCRHYLVERLWNNNLYRMTQLEVGVRVELTVLIGPWPHCHCADGLKADQCLHTSALLALRKAGEL